MKFIDEVDIELVNQALNFQTQDNNVVIRGGCDLFTTKPMSADRKLFKTIDKRLDQILEDSQFSQLLEQERRSSVDSILGSSASPPGSAPGTRRGSNVVEKKRRSSSSSLNFHRHSISNNGGSGSVLSSHHTNLSKSFNEDESAIDESPFGPLKNVTTRKTFAYLIAILNTTYPDHDFSNLQPSTENFHKLSGAEELIHKFNNVMFSLGKKEELLNWIWDTINLYMDVIPSKNLNGNISNGSGSRNNSLSKSYGFNTPLTPADSPTLGQSSEVCQIYEFQPSDQSIIEDLNYPYQTSWSHYWFIYNKKKKRVSFLYLTAINKIHYSTVNRNQGLGGQPNAEKGEDNVDEDDIYADEFIEEAYMDDVMENDDDDVVGDIEI